MKIKKYEEEDYLYISEMKLEYNEDKIFISTNMKTKKISNFEINGISFNKKFSELRLGYFLDSSFFPEFFYEKNKQTSFFNPTIEILYNINESFNNLFSDFQLHRINQDLGDNLDKEMLIENIKNILENDSKKCLSFTEKINKEPKILDKLHDILKVRDFINIYDLLTNSFCYDISNICYSKPLRANTERFYRHQPLSVNEVEPDGANLVQFYSTMSSK